jgi:hypothetical protein
MNKERIRETLKGLVSVLKFYRMEVISLMVVFALFGAWESHIKDKKIDKLNDKYNDVIERCDSLSNDLKIYKDSVDYFNEYISSGAYQKFKFVKSRFGAFNKNIQDSTVNKFIEVSEYFELDSTDEMFNMFVHEILLESGAKQFFPEGHPREGQLMESYAGADGNRSNHAQHSVFFLEKGVGPRGYEKTRMHRL